MWQVSAGHKRIVLCWKLGFFHPSYLFASPSVAVLPSPSLGRGPIVLEQCVLVKGICEGLLVIQSR